jgi:glucosyl-3-phosphoglycerate synthase
VRPDVQRWLDRRFSSAADWTAARVLADKRGRTVSVVLPALDEQETVGPIVATIRTELMGGDHPVVDELVVMDSGSTDATAAVAAAAGARVVHRDDVLPRIAARPGKGEVMWRSLAATRGDVVVFVDADLRGFTSSYVLGLVGPLLADASVGLVKAVYDRPLRDGSSVLPAGGGRVTELLARPLVNLHWPELAGVVQPLAGECAARRDLLEQVTFPTGYGIELALLVDALELLGLDGIAQVDLGERRHRHQDDARLGRMASEILQVAQSRLVRQGRLRASSGVNPTLTQFTRGPAAAGEPAFTATTHDVELVERPPMAQQPEYAAARAARAS